MNDRQQRLFSMLTQAFEDTALAGSETILGYVHHLGIRTVGGHYPSWRTIIRWAKTRDFPLCHGIHGRRAHYAALSSVLAVTAWMLSRPNNGNPFRVDTLEWQRWRDMRRAKQPSRTAPRRYVAA